MPSCFKRAYIFSFKVLRYRVYHSTSTISSLSLVLQVSRKHTHPIHTGKKVSFPQVPRQQHSAAWLEKKTGLKGIFKFILRLLKIPSSNTLNRVSIKATSSIFCKCSCLCSSHVLHTLTVKKMHEEWRRVGNKARIEPMLTYNNCDGYLYKYTQSGVDPRVLVNVH